MDDFFVTVTFQAQRDGGRTMTMRKTCLHSQAAATAKTAVEHAVSSGVLERGDTVMLEIKKLHGETGHA
jgi:hypothetical protein